MNFYISRNQNRLVYLGKRYVFQPFASCPRDVHRFGLRPEGWANHCSKCPLARVFCDPRADIHSNGQLFCRYPSRRDLKNGYWKEVDT